MDRQKKSIGYENIQIFHFSNKRAEYKKKSKLKIGDIQVTDCENSFSSKNLRIIICWLKVFVQQFWLTLRSWKFIHYFFLYFYKLKVKVYFLAFVSLTFKFSSFSLVPFFVQQASLTRKCKKYTLQLYSNNNIFFPLLLCNTLFTSYINIRIWMLFHPSQHRFLTTVRQ